MGKPVRHTVVVTTDASGDATAYSPVFSGRIESVHYVKTDFADGVDFTITSEALAENIWTESNVNASAVRRPRAPTHDGVGVASLYAAAGEPVENKIAMADDRVKIVIAQGGNVKTGTFHIVVS